MRRNWTGIIAGYLLLAFLGTAVVLVGTAYARAWVVLQALTRSERMLQAGRPGAALAQLDRTKGWSTAYAALEKRRLCLAVRCHVLRTDLPRATASAEDTIDADTGALVSRDADAMDYMLTSLVELSWLNRDPGAALSPWSGYATLIRELRRTGQGQAVDGVLKEAAARFPDGRFPPDVRAVLDGEALSAPVVTSPPRAAVTALSRPRFAFGRSAMPPVSEPAGDASVPAREEPPYAEIEALLAAGRAAEAAAACRPWLDLRPDDPTLTDLLSRATAGAEVTPPSSAIDASHTTDASRGAGDTASGPRWGVIKVSEGHAYEVNGKFRQSLPAGTIVDVRDVRDTSAGRLAICRLTDAVGPSILVPENELDLHPGRYSDASPAERRLRSRRAVVMARIEKARQAATPPGPAEDWLSKANPHADAYRKAKGELDALQRRAADVQARWDKATGGERMKYADELREMKTEQVRLETACRQVRSKAEEWAAAHPVPPAEATPPASPPESTPDEMELAEIDKQLKML